MGGTVFANEFLSQIWIMSASLFENCLTFLSHSLWFSYIAYKMFRLIFLNYWPSTYNVYYLEEYKEFKFNHFESHWLSVGAYRVNTKKSNLRTFDLPPTDVCWKQLHEFVFLAWKREKKKKLKQNHFGKANFLPTFYLGHFLIVLYYSNL